MFNENQDIFGIDQTTPRRDAELFNKTEFDKGFGEAFTESVYGTVGENLLRYAATMPKLQNLGLIPQAPKSWGPNIPANELNKKFGVDIFKDDMSEHQALMIKTIRDLKNKELQRSSIYDGGTFLGQNAPQWAGGFVGTAVSNPLVTLPYGRAATTLGTVGQGIVSNMTGAVLDWSYRKQMESRTGDEATVAQLLTDLSVGTAFGIGADVVANKVRGRKAFDLGKSPEELLGIKREKELATPDKPQAFRSWVEQAHSDYLQRRAEMVDSLSSGYAKEGIRVDMNTLGKMIDPYPHKIDIVEVTHADGTKQKMMVPRDANQVDYDNIGNVKRKIPEDATFKVDGEEFPTLERANEVAKTTNSDVEVTLKEGETFRLPRIEVEKEINAAREAFRVKKINDFIPEGTIIEVDGIEFDDLGKAAAFAKASNSQVTLKKPIRPPEIPDAAYIPPELPKSITEPPELPAELRTLAKLIDPYPVKLSLFELIQEGGKRVLALLPEKSNSRLMTDVGFEKFNITPNTKFRVAGEFVDSLEEANAKANKFNPIEIIHEDGTITKLEKVDAEKLLAETTPNVEDPKKIDIADDATISVDGTEFSTIEKAVAYAKAVNSKVDIIEADGTKWKVDPPRDAVAKVNNQPVEVSPEVLKKTETPLEMEYEITKIDPPIEFIPENPIVKDQGTRAQFGDPEAIAHVKAIVDNPDLREHINPDDVKTFQEFDVDSAKMSELAEFEKEIDFMVEGFDTEIKAQGEKAPKDLIKHLDSINEIDKTAELEDNVFKAITNCILRSL